MTGTKNLKLFVLLLALFACGKEEQQPAEQRTEFSSVAEEEAVKEDFELKPVDFSSLTGWKNDDLKTAMAALALSCQKIVSSSDEFLSDKAIVKIPTAAYKDYLKKAISGSLRLILSLQSGFPKSEAMSIIILFMAGRMICLK